MELYTVPTSSGTVITQATFNNQDGSDFKFKVTDPTIAQTFSFYPKITFGISPSNTFVKYSTSQMTKTVTGTCLSSVLVAPAAFEFT